MADKERITYNPEAISNGLIIAQRIISGVNNVIAHELPLLAGNNIVNPNKLTSSSPDELMASEELTKPVVPMGIHRSLIASGITEDLIKTYKRRSVATYSFDPTDQNSVLIQDGVLQPSLLQIST